MVILCLPNMKAIVVVFSAFDTVIPPSITYMSILISFAPATMSSAILKIILDPIFIFGLAERPSLPLSPEVVPRPSSSSIFLAVKVHITFAFATSSHPRGL